MLRPKRRRINYVIIIILGKVTKDLENDINSGLIFDIDTATRLPAFVDLMDTDEGSWTQGMDDIYDAFDIMGGLIESEAEESVIEDAYNEWVGLM